MALTTVRSKALGEFLKSRRERVQPEDVGITQTYGRRRARGLRREEIAVLSGVSTTWYTWLEQGRDIQPSREVLESISRALKLPEAEANHLLKLADYLIDPQQAPLDPMLPDLQRLVDQMSYPAYISNYRTEVLVFNRLAANLFGDFMHLSAFQRVLIRLFFLRPTDSFRIVNVDEFTRYCVGVLRTTVDLRPDDLMLHQLVDELTQESALFRELWALHDIRLKTTQQVILDYPHVGRLTFDVSVLQQINGRSDLHCCIYQPRSGTDTEERLPLLLNL